MKPKLPLGLLWLPALLSCVCSAALAESLEKTLDITYESPVLIQQADVSVTLADFVAYLDWRVPAEEQRRVLSSPERIEGILESIVLIEALMHRLGDRGALNGPSVQASIYQAAARQARALYRQRLTDELELDSYESQARELYMVEPERFQRRETINFDHILVAVGDERDEVTAMRRAADVYDALAEGQPFSEVAELYSDDSGFDDHRGRFEGIDTASLVPPVAQAAESLEVGELSVPIQSRFGWHIFTITKVNEGEQMSWEEAQPIAEEVARERHLGEAYQRRLREINTAPMQFADGAVKTILEHYEIEGFGMPISESDDGTDAN
jgi:hypothetical protein